MSFFSGRRQEQPPAPPPVVREEKIEPPRVINPIPAPSPAPAPLPPQQPVGFETVLGTNSTFEGTLRSSANVRLDGSFSGTLDINGNVLIGETAKINADVKARNISVAGAVRGNIIGKKVQILRTGRIWGDITANALTTEEGAFIDGKIKMSGGETPSVESQQPTPPSGTAVTAIMDAPEEPTTAATEPEPEFTEELPTDDEEKRD